MAFEKNNLSNRISYSKNTSFNVNSSIYPTIEAVFNPSWNLTMNFSTEFNDVYTKTDYIAKGNILPVMAPLSQTINNRDYKFVCWSDNNSLPNPRTMTISSNTSLIPFYKYLSHSTQTNGYSNNGQRKLIKTDGNGYLHNVYTSMDKVWYEMSTDNGTTWEIMNNGKPLSWSASKNPSLASNSGDRVIISFQEQDPVTQYSNIKVLVYDYARDVTNDLKVLDSQYPYSQEMHPVISLARYSSFEYLLLAWETQTVDGWYVDGINYRFAIFDDTGVHISWQTGTEIIPSTNETCINPTIMGGSSYPAVFHIAYQQNTSSTTSKIWYDSVNVDTDGFEFVNNRKEVSYGSGFTKNYNPSIIEINGGARVVWIGERTELIDDKDIDPTPGGNGTTPGLTTVRSVVFKSPQYYRFWNFGSDPQYPTITKSSDNLTYIVAWNEITTHQNKFVNNQLNAGDIKNFGINGNCVQVANALNKQGMLGLVFDASTSPYSFNKTSNIGSFYPKAGNSGLSVNYGRQGLVGKDSLQFYFAIGDIIKDQQHIKFINLPEEFAVNSLESLNYALISEPFVINDGESFVYSVQYGMVGNQYAQLSDGKQVNFKVKLIDANTGELLRVFDNVTYSGSNLQNYNNILYQVSVNEIGSKTVKMCLEVNDNLNGFYTVTDKMNDEDVLAKLNFKDVNLVENIEITSYDLFQNYPNPFNPSTTISYQVPDNCRVTLKVFDVLGKEVTTLVDEYKSKGKYDVQFNAKHLASGMYIYQIKAGDFVSSKKLMLMK